MENLRNIGTGVDHDIEKITPIHGNRLKWYYKNKKGEAAVKYELSSSSVKGYLRLYCAETGLTPRTCRKKPGNTTQHIEDQKDYSLKEYESMSKEGLIDALVMARINEARLKKATQ